jgi:two-component system, OmpR family, phosphate regulon sensor histidine kinase PhoR
MATTGSSDTLPSSDHSCVVQRIAGPRTCELPPTLVAKAGHNLRRPPPVRTVIYDYFASVSDTEEQLGRPPHDADANIRLAKILGQVEEVIQLHQRSRDIVLKSVQLRPLFDNLTAEFEKPATSKGIRLLAATPRPTASSHPALLACILRNLIQNALDYTPSGGKVFVTCRRFRSELRIAVRDTGVGIRASALSNIFGAFQRADHNGRCDGLGLGLYIAKQAANLLNHRIEVRSVEGRGSCFTVVTNTAQSRTAEEAAIC